MDQKQFDMFQQGIQWVVDERRRKDTTEPPTDGRIHYQAAWAQGRVDGPVRSVIAPDESYEVYAYPVCPTACCVAGNFCAINGDTFLATGMTHTGQFVGSVEWVLDEETGEVHRIGHRARDLTGMGDVEASRLFHQDNRPEQVISLATTIAENHGYQLRVV